MCLIIIFPVMYHICLIVKGFLHILVPSQVFLPWYFPLDKRTKAKISDHNANKLFLFAPACKSKERSTFVCCDINKKKRKPLHQNPFHAATQFFDLWGGASISYTVQFWMSIKTVYAGNVLVIHFGFVRLYITVAFGQCWQSIQIDTLPVCMEDSLLFI